MIDEKDMKNIIKLDEDGNVITPKCPICQKNLA